MIEPLWSVGFGDISASRIFDDDSSCCRIKIAYYPARNGSIEETRPDTYSSVSVKYFSFEIRSDLLRSSELNIVGSRRGQMANLLTGSRCGAWV